MEERNKILKEKLDYAKNDKLDAIANIQQELEDKNLQLNELTQEVDNLNAELANQSLAKISIVYYIYKYIG